MKKIKNMFIRPIVIFSFIGSCILIAAPISIIVFSSLPFIFKQTYSFVFLSGIAGTIGFLFYYKDFIYIIKEALHK
jgi:uncharacterized membrane protein